MPSPFESLKVEKSHRPQPEGYAFDLDRTLQSIVALEAHIADDAFTAEALGTYRVGNGAVIGANGLVLTIGYLVMEAHDVTLTLSDGRRVAAHVLAADPITGLGLVQALDTLDAPVLKLGRASDLAAGDRVVVAGAGGREHAVAAQVLTRMPFTASWEYKLDEAIFSEPAHPHWSGAALIDLKGDLLGIGSLVLHRQSRGGLSPLNMIVPVDPLPPILEDLARGKSPLPPRPWLGLLSQEMGDLVVVVGFNGRGPAARAELRPGDTIVALNGAPIADLADFYAKLWASGPAGVTVRLTLRRGGDVFEVDIRTADRNQLLRRPRPN